MLFLSGKKFNELTKKVAAIAEKVGITETDVVNYDDLKKDKELKRKVAYALNLCTVSVSQIIDYNDIYILEQEYDAILNNLNIQNFIKDESLLKVLKQILDTITFFKIQEGDKRFIEKEYQQKMKNAIWSAVPNLSVIFAGGNPITMAIAAASQIGIGYMNYRKNKNQYLLEREKQDWELQRSAIEQFNGLRRELFEAAWRLSDRFDFDDSYRLTEKQISQYDAILLDPDPLRRYERLDVIAPIFEAFPPYWYYKGNAAKEIADVYKDTNPEIVAEYKKNALENYEKFDSIYIELMREDVIAASCSLEHIVLLDSEHDKEKINLLLERAIRLAGNNLDVLQQCVFHYISLMIHEPTYSEKPITILRRLVNEDYNTALNGQMLSRIYCKYSHDRVAYDILSDRVGSVNVIPWIDDDEESQREFLENSHTNLCERFSIFLDGYKNKYEPMFNKIVPYQFSVSNIPDEWYREDYRSKRKDNLFLICKDEQQKADFLGNLALHSRYIELSNEMFENLFQSELFTLTNTDTNSWKEIFDTLANKMQEIINKIITKQEEIKQYTSIN
jgi:hypothetical protein